MPRASQGEGDFSGTVCLHGTYGLFEHETSQSWSHPPHTPCHTAIATLLTLATFPSIRWPFAHSSPTLGHAGSIGAHQSSLLTTFAACPEHFGHQEWCQVFEIERPSN